MSWYCWECLHLLLMYKYTGEEKHLYRASKMAELMQSDKVFEAIATSYDPQQPCQGVADFPCSLMKSLAGTICYHCDLLQLKKLLFLVTMEKLVRHDVHC